MRSYAEFDGARKQWRYRLGRWWADEQLFHGRNSDQYALFIMLNPSTADATKNDATVAKCGRLARRWGFGGIEVVNIFAIRGTDPKIIRQVPDPVGPGNDAAILAAMRDPRCGAIVAAWGNHGKFAGRADQVWQMLNAGLKSCCFRVSGQGEPEHPLYQRECDLAEMIPFTEAF